MAFTIVTENEMTFMAGELVDPTGNITANRQFLHDYAGAYLSVLVQYDIVTNWGSLSTIYKHLFTEWAARFAASQLIAYNMATIGATFSSLIEPEDMIQLHIYRMEQIEKRLKEIKIKDFLGV